MNGREQRARLLPVRNGDLEHARAPAGRDLGKAAIGEIHRLGVGGMHLDERLRHVRAQSRALPRPRHGVPLVAQAAGVEAKRKFLAGRNPGRGRFDRDEARLAVRRIEAASHEKPPVLVLHCFAGA